MPVFKMSRNFFCTSLANRITRDHIIRVHEDTLCTTADRRFAYGKSKTVSLSMNEIAIRIIQIVSFICACVLLVRCP